MRSSYHMGDCLEKLWLIPDKSVDLVFCDMPYGTTNARWDSVLDLRLLWQHYKRVCKPNAAILLTAQTPFDKVLGCSNLKWLRYEWIFEKTAATGYYNAKKMPMKAHENILVFYHKTPTYNPQKTFGHSPVNSFTKYIETQNRTEIYGSCTKEVSGGGNTDRYPRSVQIFKSDKQKLNINPTQKPLAMVEYFIKTYSNEGDVVLDNCAGSFTTGVACVNTKRNYILIEKDPIEFEKGKNRLINHTAIQS